MESDPRDLPDDARRRRGPHHRPSPFELGTDGPSSIVVAVDGTSTSLRAAAFAVGQARRQRARLLVVYVRDRLPAAVALSTAAGGGEALAAAYELQDQAERDLRAALRDLVGGAAVRYSVVVRIGDPYQEITRIACEVGADSLVVGASTRLGHRIAGSLAVRLVRSGRWPVTVVP